MDLILPTEKPVCLAISSREFMYQYRHKKTVFCSVGSAVKNRFRQSRTSFLMMIDSALGTPETHCPSSSRAISASVPPRFRLVRFLHRSMAWLRVSFPKKVESRWGLLGGMLFQADK